MQSWTSRIGVILAVTGSAVGLGNFLLPGVFELMPAGRLFGFLFFVLLFLAALTSSISMLQPSMAFFEEALGWGRRRAVLLLAGIVLVGLGSVIWAAQGTIAIDTLDFWAGTLGITVVALITTVVFGWVWGSAAGVAELRRGAEIALPPGLSFIMRWITPTALLIILAWFVWGEVANLRQGKGVVIAMLSDNGARLVVLWMLGTIALYLAIARRGMPRWEALAAEDRR